MKLVPILCLCLSILSCGFEQDENDLSQIINPTDEVVSNEPVSAIKKITVDKEIAEIGERLFHDQKLSADGSISCSSCHDLNKAGVDNLQFSPGINGMMERLNTPTVINSHFNFKQFWDGRAADLEEQVNGPILAPNEMGNNWESVLEYLKKDQTYLKGFNELFIDGVTKNNVMKCIAEFERTLIYPSRFDDYLNGDEDAITQDELAGYNLFKDRGCVSCHNGVNIGGGMYQKIGLASNYFENRGNITEADFGLYNVTQEEADKFYFKVPSLRNVAKTEPYFHDGSQKTLKQAINTMARYQLGNYLDSTEVVLIESFLNSLTSKEYEN